MAVTLALGPVVFHDFEVPESLPFGGEQMLAVHKQPGGARVIDALGPDDRDIAWSGRFRAFEAESRAKQLDALRKAGRPLLLTWSTFRYRVVIQSFHPDYQQPFEIPYTISCVVETDESAPVAAFAPGLDEQIGAGLSNLLGLGAPLSIAGVTDSITAVQSAVAAAGSLRSATRSGIGGLVGAITGAQTSAEAAITQVESTLGVPPAGNASAIAANLSGQAAAFGQLSQLYQVAGTLKTMSRTLAG